MKVKELIEHLRTANPDAEVVVEDINYGTKYSDVEHVDIRITTNYVYLPGTAQEYLD